MDIATIVGIVSGAAVVLVAIILGGDPGSFVNIPSICIVIGGGLAATVIRFPLANIFQGLALGGKVAFTHKNKDAKEMIDEIAQLAEVVRKDGPLGLENVDIEDPLLKKGAQFVADGYEDNTISETLELERDLYLGRLEEGKLIYKSLGDAAPAFGMIGTLVGLVQMLSTMDDPASIGPSMAVALLTTLYGAVIANLICLPIADKLSTKSKIEDTNSTLTIDGVKQLRAGKNPNVIREMLQAYMSDKQRAEALVEAAA